MGGFIPPFILCRKECVILAAITPSTNLKLLKNPNNLSNENQLTFANATAQYNYFNSLTKIEVDDFTYQRKDYTIRYKACIDDILDYNYVMYQNSAYTDKWFYAYITNMRWLNDHVTEITISTDAYQTYMFDITFKASFVEREHVNDDTVGLHTIPEGLETGDYVTQTGTETAVQIKDLAYLSDTYIVMGLSDTPNIAIPAGNRLYGNVYSGLIYYVFDSGSYADEFIRYTEKTFTENVVYTVFMIPKALANISAGSWVSGTYTAGGSSFNLKFAYLPYSTSAVNIGEIGYNKETYLDDNYIPVNGKLLTYPYRYLVCSNNVGTTQIYKYELFSTTGCGFKIDGTVTPGCSIKIYPENYAEGNIISSVDAAKLPTCSWTNDAYTNWLTQNSVNLKLDTIKNVGSIVGGIIVGATTAGMGGVAGWSAAYMGASGVLDTMKTVYEHSLVPTSSQGGANNGDLLFAKAGTFSFYKYSIKKEYARVIDNYLSMYGYKVTTVKVPNITGRANWNYVKCIGANIEGLIPEFYLNEIKNIFNAGVTLWHNPSTFLDYSQSNTIVT